MPAFALKIALTVLFTSSISYMRVNKTLGLHAVGNGAETGRVFAGTAVVSPRCAGIRTAYDVA